MPNPFLPLLTLWGIIVYMIIESFRQESSPAGAARLVPVWLALGAVTLVVQYILMAWSRKLQTMMVPYFYNDQSRPGIQASIGGCVKDWWKRFTRNRKGRIALPLDDNMGYGE